MTDESGRWVLASGNTGKLKEIQAVLTDTGIELVSQGELGVESPEETGATFIENALLKARPPESNSEVLENLAISMTSLSTI